MNAAWGAANLCDERLGVLGVAVEARGGAADAAAAGAEDADDAVAVLVDACAMAGAASGRGQAVRRGAAGATRTGIAATASQHERTLGGWVADHGRGALRADLRGEAQPV